MTNRNPVLRSLGIPPRTTIDTLYERRFYLAKRRRYAQAAWRLRNRNRRVALLVIETAQWMRWYWYEAQMLPHWLKYNAPETHD